MRNRVFGGKRLNGSQKTKKKRGGLNPVPEVSRPLDPSEEVHNKKKKEARGKGSAIDRSQQKKKNGGEISREDRSQQGKLSIHVQGMGLGGETLRGKKRSLLTLAGSRDKKENGSVGGLGWINPGLLKNEAHDLAITTLAKMHAM